MNGTGPRARAIALVVFAVAVWSAPLLLGGVTGWATVTTAALATVACWSAVFVTRDRRVAVPSAVIAITIAALGWTAAQAMPLPCDWVEWLAPKAAEVQRGAAELSGVDASCALSMDPGATRTAVLRASAVANLAMAGFLLAAAGERRRVCEVVLSSIVLLALLAVIHLAADARSVFGVYRPRHAPNARFGPVLNPNNLAGFVVLAIPLAFVSFHRARASRGKLFASFSLVILTSVGMLTLSRAGIAVIVVELAAGYWLLRRASRGRAVAVAGGMAVAGLAGLLAVLPRFEDEIIAPDFRKLDLVIASWEFALDAPGVGVGRGAFSSAFTEVGGTYRRWTHAEHFPAQWIAEWGLPFATALMVVLGGALLRTIRSSRSTTQRGAALAVVGIATHNLLDFGLELTAAASLAGVLVGAALAPQEAAAMGQRSPALWLGGIVMLASTFALSFLGRSAIDDDPERLRVQLETALRSRDASAFDVAIRRAVRSHPADPTFALLAGAERASRRDGSALAWLNRAMVLAPGWAAPHVEAARYLVAVERTDQALLEIREAATRHAETASDIACQLYRARPDARTVRRTLPHEGPGRRYLLEVSTRCLPLMAPGAEQLDAEIVQDHPDLVGAALRQLARQQRGGESIASELATLVRRHPERLDVALAYARAQADEGDPGAAAASLQETMRRLGRSRDLLRALATHQAHAGDPEGVRATITQLRGLEGGSEREIAGVERFHARMQRLLGNDAEALRALQAAQRYAPNQDTAREIRRLMDVGTCVPGAPGCTPASNVEQSSSLNE